MRGKSKTIRDIYEDVKLAEEYRKIQRENSILKQSNIDLKVARKKLEKEVAEWETRVRFIEQIEGPCVAHTWEEKPVGKNSPVAPIIQLSDWHVGETVRPETINGLNAYTPAIARRRAARTFQKIGDYIERHLPMAKVAYIHFGGDFITGHIHEELVESNSLSPVQETILAKELLCNGIEYLRRRKIVKKLIIPTSVGNHGRTTQKKRIATSCLNSFEWLMYNDIAHTYAKDPFVDVVVGDGYHTILEIFGRRVAFSHGDAIQYQGGIGGPTIPIIKAIAGWQKSPVAAELYLMGHLHQFINGGSFVVNSSLIGYGPFSMFVKAGFEPPSQTFIGFSKSRGMYLAAKMFCDE